MGEKPTAAQSATSPTDFSTGSRGRSNLFCRASSASRVYVGWSSAKAIIANNIAPGLIDRFLAHTGYDSQQYDGAENPNRAHNLWEPVPGDHGAHGDFNARAKKSSAFLWMSEQRGWLLLIAATVALLTIAIFTVR